jgi:hypothetical protein
MIQIKKELDTSSGVQWVSQASALYSRNRLSLSHFAVPPKNVHQHVSCELYHTSETYLFNFLSVPLKPFDEGPNLVEGLGKCHTVPECFFALEELPNLCQVFLCGHSSQGFSDNSVPHSMSTDHVGSNERSNRFKSMESPNRWAS